MKSIGVIFSEPMVVAILDGRKNQTRRLKGLEKLNGGYYKDRIDKVELREDVWCFWEIGHGSSALPVFTAKSPFGTAGDELWVRETWGVHKAFESWWNDGNRDLGPGLIIFKAGDRDPTAPVERWRPAIHLFERYARIRRPIVSVRPERLQEITEQDAKNEGVETPAAYVAWKGLPGPMVQAYSVLWDHLNGKKAPWSSNPWVWRVEFERMK